MHAARERPHAEGTNVCLILMARHPTSQYSRICQENNATCVIIVMSVGELQKTTKKHGMKTYYTSHALLYNRETTPSRPQTPAHAMGTTVREL